MNLVSVFPNISVLLESYELPFTISRALRSLSLGGIFNMEEIAI